MIGLRKKRISKLGEVKMSFSLYVTKRPGNLCDITGVKREEFEKIVEKVRPEWEKVEKLKRGVTE
jgi:hypothetical protein